MDSDLGFWIFIASIVVAGIWSSSRKQAERHETLRRIVEKTGTIDEAKLKELFSEESADEVRPGYVYRGLRIWGTVVMSLGAGLATCIVVAATLGKIFGVVGLFDDPSGWIVGIGVAAFVAMLGLGLFASSRFAEPPLR